MGVNHFGVFLLTNLLLDKITETKGRIVVLSSGASEWGHINPKDWQASEHKGIKGGMKAYSNSKLANVLFTVELQRRLGDKATVNAVHPGFVQSELSRNAPFPLRIFAILAAKLVAKNSWQGAQTSLYVATAPELEGVGGQYFEHCRKSKLRNRQAADVDLQKKFWDVSCELVGLPKDS